MDLLSSAKQDVKKRMAEASSAISLLDSGLNYFRQGQYLEGIAFFALAREQLSPNMIHLAGQLDVLIQDYVGYCQAQQALQQASERLVQAHTKQQEHTTSLAKLLSEVQRNTGNQPSDLALIPPSLPIAEGTENHCMPPAVAVGSKDEPFASTFIEPIPPHDPIHETQQAEEGVILPALYFSCFGRFEVKRLGQTISLCSNRNGQAILRYLVAQSKYRVTKDVLMMQLWPEDEPEVASHKLQVAISALRRSLNAGYVSDSGGGYILCKNGVYQLNPTVPIQTDVGEFLALYQAGRQQNNIGAVVPHYEAACNLYKGPFLTEDLYVDWPIIQREQLNKAYLAMCGTLSEHYLQLGSYEDAAKWAAAILNENQCDEVAYRLLMRINLAAGRRSEVLRLYQRCERILAEELNVAPMPETVRLFHNILSNDSSR